MLFRSGANIRHPSRLASKPACLRRASRLDAHRPPPTPTAVAATGRISLDFTRDDVLCSSMPDSRYPRPVSSTSRVGSVKMRDASPTLSLPYVHSSMKPARILSRSRPGVSSSRKASTFKSSAFVRGWRFTTSRFRWYDASAAPATLRLPSASETP